MNLQNGSPPPPAHLGDMATVRLTRFGGIEHAPAARVIACHVNGVTKMSGGRRSLEFDNPPPRHRLE